MCGKYAEALEAADRGITVVHFGGWKAAALAQSGRLEEARTALGEFFATMRAQWFGRSPATQDEMTRWFLHLSPIKQRADWERLREGLESAGAPRTSLKHNEW
jgi:hypothetical protein